MTIVSSNPSFYMAPNLIRSLDRLKKKVEMQDMDVVLVIDGSEGSGKSVFAMQIGRYLDESLNLSRVCMNPEEFKNAIINATPHQCIIFDEAFTGLSSRTSLSAVNKVLISKMMEMRQKNLFVLIVLPSFFMLDRYVSLFRARALFHVYMSGAERGYWIGFNQKKKKELYLKGKKDMSYKRPYVYSFKGRFRGKFVLNEQEYREKKRKALEEEEEQQDNARTVRFKNQRDILIADFVDRNNFSFRKAEREMKKIGFNKFLSLSHHQIGKICHEIAKKPENVA
jgi:hypothetical protein